MDDEDFWDPNNWPEQLPYQALFLSDRDDSLYVIVDRIDYAWASKHLWRLVKSSHKSRGPNGHARSYAITTRPGTRGGIVFLHKEIVFRAYGPPPSEQENIGDHWNGDSLDDRRKNLRWASPKENRLNRHGSAYYGLLL